MRSNAGRTAGKVVAYAALAAGSVFCLLPVFWLVRSSVMMLGDIFKYPPIVWPARIRWQNYQEAMKSTPFLLYFRNTMIVVTPNVVGSLLTASMSAYGLARFRFPTRSFWFTMVLGAIILPPAVVLIPQFLMWSGLRLVNIPSAHRPRVVRRRGLQRVPPAPVLPHHPQGLRQRGAH